MMKKIIKEAFAMLRRYPNLSAPFLIIGVIDFCALYLLYLAPQRPIAIVLAPPIRAFWGERFLHYPMNLFLLPKLYNYAYTVLLATLGVLTTGCAIAMIKEACSGKKPAVARNLFYALQRYVSLLIIGVIIFVVSFFLGKASTQLTGVLFYVIHFIHILVQVVLLYAMVAIVLKRATVISAIRQSFLLAKRSCVATLIIAAITVILYVPVVVLKQQLGPLVNTFSPGIIMVVLSIGIIVTVIIDTVITFLVSLLFLEQEKQIEG